MPENTGNNRTHSGLLLAALVPSFYLTEWLLVTASAALFAWLRHRGVGIGQIWLLFWAGNFALSGLLILGNDRLGVDITLMQGLRSLTEAATRRAPRLGLALELGICIRLLLWDGPCQLLIFCRRRFPSRPAQLAFLTAASGLQMLVWAKLYAWGYAGIGDLFGS